MIMPDTTECLILIASAVTGRVNNTGESLYAGNNEDKDMIKALERDL